MLYLDNILFLLVLITGIGLFIRNLKRIYLNILLGHKPSPIKHRNKRWLLVLKVALGRGRINNKPLVGVLHFLVYVGFFIINISILEVLIDGIFGTHRFFATVFPLRWYRAFTVILEFLALSTSIAVGIFFIRRNFIKIPRLTHPDLKGWATKDANWILFLELIMMWLFLQMNAADSSLQAYGIYPNYGLFPISEIIFSETFRYFNDETLIIIERGSWWLHFIGILFFLNYICYSKHLHIILAFPNIWYSYKEKQGKINNMKSVTHEIRQILNPLPENFSQETLTKFGVEDVFDLNRIQLLNAYSCVECGRCTEVCPANITGKKLSPRKIMMSVRDRIEEVGNNIKTNGKFQKDHKTLLKDYISDEEIWACTTCMACTEVCPLHIDPTSIIIDMRRFMVMEQSKAPQDLNKIMNNIENNSTLWQYSPEDREGWKTELEREINSKN